MKIKNKTIKIILFIIFIIFISIIFSNKSNANTIYSINMYVNIIDNGDAQVVEIWDTYLDEGTEGYKSFANLGYSDITNFSVTDDTGIKYTEAFIWNTDSSFANKAYKYGKKCTNNSLELCWGISKYGHRVYTLQYVIKNFVTQFADAQGIYFNLLKMNQYVGNCNIKIHSNAIEFSPENSEIWCFGNDGTINFEGGDIVLRSNGELSSYEYMVPLIRFKENVYNIRTNISQKFFNDVYNEALYKSNNRGSFAKDIALVMYVVFLPLILMFIISIIKVKKN